MSKRLTTRRVVCISDMHVGSKFGLWPAGLGDLPLLDHQKKLLSYWHDFWKWAKPYDTVLLLGDICDGQNRKEFGRYLRTTELERQVEAACKLLGPHLNGARVYAVSGSNYHQSMDMDLDRLVTERLQGDHCGVLLNLELEGTGKVLQARHGSSGALMYRGGNMDMESLLLDAAQGTGILGFKVDILVRGHWHWYGLVENRSRLIVQCPGWKLFFPFKGADRYGKFLPDIGAVKLEVTNDSAVCLKRLYPYIPVIDKVKT